MVRKEGRCAPMGEKQNPLVDVLWCFSFYQALTLVSESVEPCHFLWCYLLLVEKNDTCGPTYEQ